MSLQTQSVLKNTSGSQTVTFTEAYTTPPVVILTPYSKGSTVPVDCVLTITEITTTSCTFTSIDAASNYYVNVLSIGDNSSLVKSLKAQWGAKAKTESILNINFHPFLSSPDPIILLTSYWKGSQQAVGFVDTIDNSAASECSVVSKNMAPDNYFVNFLVMDPGIATMSSNHTLQNGIVNKTGAGIQRVYFSKPFSDAPTVFLSPWWMDGSGGVDSIETLINVTEYYFEYISKNVAGNYFVNWVAVAN